VNCRRFCENPAVTKPSARLTAPTSTGTITPKRSESLPSARRPAEPDHGERKGSEASARASRTPTEAAAAPPPSSTSPSRRSSPARARPKGASRRRGIGLAAMLGRFHVGRALQRERKQCRDHRESTSAERASDQWIRCSPPIIPTVTPEKSAHPRAERCRARSRGRDRRGCVQLAPALRHGVERKLEASPRRTGSRAQP